MADKFLIDASSNFSKVEFHKPTKSITGCGLQITANLNGSLNFQMAKQLTEHKNKNSPGTYAWRDNTKNILFNLSADELRITAELIKKILSGRVKLFIKDKHNPMIIAGKDPGFDNAFFYHSPASKNDKSITIFGKEYNGKTQMELRVYEKKKSLTLMFSFDLSEIKKLYDLISNHTYRELELPNGYKSVITDAKGMIMRECYLPPYSKGEIFQFADGKYEIVYKSHIFSKNLTHYCVRPAVKK